MDIKSPCGVQENKIIDSIYSTEGLMALLQVSRRTVQNWRDEGTIEFSQINGKIYYRMSAIAKMLDQNLIKK